jgi:hypothetical protein
MRLAAIAVVLLAVAASSAQAGVRFRYTHRFVATGQFVDHWTINDPGYCGAVGDGTITFDFRSTSPTRAMVTIDPTHNGEPNNTLGSWTLLAPGDAFGHITDIPGKAATATANFVDNSVATLPPDGGDCGGGIDKGDCGMRALKGERVEVSGYNRKLIKGDLFGEFAPPRFACGAGSSPDFSTPPALVGGNRRGELLIKMPKPSALRRKVVRVTATTHKKTAFADPGSATVTDDITRTFTVTFTRIR